MKHVDRLDLPKRSRLFDGDAPACIVVVGASAGGVQPLQDLVGALPVGFAAAAFVVLHLPADRPSALAEVLQVATHLPVTQARSDEPVLAGRIYVAPPGCHLTVEAERVRLRYPDRGRASRRAIDTLFESAAKAYGPRVIAVILSGMLDDGVAGLRLVKAVGGTALVQDPSTAACPDMPLAATEAVAVDAVLAPRALGAEIGRRVEAARRREFPVRRVA